MKAAYYISEEQFTQSVTPIIPAKMVDWWLANEEENIYSDSLHSIAQEQMYVLKLLSNTPTTSDLNVSTGEI